MGQLVNDISRELEILQGQLLPFIKESLERKFPEVTFEVTETYVKAIIGDKVRWIMFDLGKPLLSA